MTSSPALYICSVSIKLLVQTSRVSSSQQNKKEKHIKLCSGVSGFWVWWITFYNKYLKYVLCYLQLAWYIYSTRSQSLGFLLFFKAQFTTNAQNGLLLMHAPSFMNCRAVSKVPGPLRMVWGAKEIHWWSVSLFSIGAEYIRDFKCPNR